MKLTLATLLPHWWLRLKALLAHMPPSGTCLNRHHVLPQRRRRVFFELP